MEDISLEARFDTVFLIRDAFNKALEELREQKIVTKSVEALPSIIIPPKMISTLGLDKEIFLAECLKVPNVIITPGEKLSVAVAPAPGAKCKRCLITKEKTVKLFDDQVCKKCLTIIFWQLFNNFIEAELVDGKECMLLVDHREHRELTPYQVYMNIHSYLREDEKETISDLLENFYDVFFTKKENIYVHLEDM